MQSGEELKERRKNIYIYTLAISIVSIHFVYLPQGKSRALNTLQNKDQYPFSFSSSAVAQGRLKWE